MMVVLVKGDSLKGKAFSKNALQTVPIAMHRGQFSRCRLSDDFFAMNSPQDKGDL